MPDIERPAADDPTEVTDGMGLFAELVSSLGNLTGSNDKLDALGEYFTLAEKEDRVWVIALFSGRRPKRSVTSTQLQAWCREVTGLPVWLFDESYQLVGDLAETIALLLPPGQESDRHFSLSHYLRVLRGLHQEDEETRKRFILGTWAAMNQTEKFVFNKLITGGFRVGVSQSMMVIALARSAGMESSLIAHRISGNWDPDTTSFDELLSGMGHGASQSKPYPFYLAYPLDDGLSSLGNPREWIAEWKWDGIRGQVIRRDQGFFVWSRGEELITDKFPEYLSWLSLLPEGIVLDGEIIGLSKDTPEGVSFKPLPFAALQTRITRKSVTKKQLLEVPAGFIAYDLLEFDYADWRSRGLAERREKLASILEEIHHPALWFSEGLRFDGWEQLEEIRLQARERGAEGLMLKRKESRYLTGRKRGDWWKWKIDPLVIDAVLVYAQKGHGRRGNLYTDYTFAVKDGEKLVSFAKAYSGLTDREIEEVDQFIKANSLEKFGPVRTVKPELVFEIAFEGIQVSPRHKSGIAVRFPRINRWRKDKKIDEINTLDDLKKLLNQFGG